MSKNFCSFLAGMSRSKRLHLSICCALFSIVALAQTTQVSQVSGRVSDPTGTVVPTAEVKITNIETGFTRSAQTDADGAVVLPNLPVGQYKLEVQKQGFTSYVQQKIVLQVNTNPSIPVTLQVGPQSEHIEVQAYVAMVETHSTVVGQVIDQSRVVELPLNGRNVTQLVGLSGAAVAYEPSRDGGQALVLNKNHPTASPYSVAGGQAGQTLFALDGAPHMDPSSNIGLPMPMPDALQEFKLETSSLPANYGTQPGGVVNVVTKSGTNQLNGSVTGNDGLKRHHFRWRSRRRHPP